MLSKITTCLAICIMCVLNVQSKCNYAAGNFTAGGFSVSNFIATDVCISVFYSENMSYKMACVNKTTASLKVYNGSSSCTGTLLGSNFYTNGVDGNLVDCSGSSCYGSLNFNCTNPLTVFVVPFDVCYSSSKLTCSGVGNYTTSDCSGTPDYLIPLNTCRDNSTITDNTNYCSTANSNAASYLMYIVCLAFLCFFI